MSIRYKYLLTGIILIWLTACSVARTAPKESLRPFVLVTVPANATLTPTPFLPRTPAPPTPTPFQPQTPVPPTETPTPPPPVQPIYAGAPPQPGRPWGNYPAPIIFSSIAIPPPVGVLPQPSGQFNILLLGSDKRPNQGGFRTDTMILVTINTRDKKISMTSFPRDLFIYIPGWTMQRLNTAQARGGFPVMAMTFEYNFGVSPDRYIMINFDGFKQVIDSLGGVDVYTASAMTGQRDGYGMYTVPAGLVPMDGETALWYVRSRTNSSDIDRLRRGQEVMQAIAQKLLSLNALTRAPELYNQYRSSVETNLTLEDVLKLLPTASSLSSASNIDRYVMDFRYLVNWIEPYTNAMVLLPRREAIVQLMRAALNVP